jgi:CRISPR/Cas system-associated exonuclease Cas4 (RecB family)
LICGKFVLTSLLNHLYSKNVKSFSAEELRWWLFDHIDVEPLAYLANSIDDIISKYKKGGM